MFKMPKWGRVERHTEVCIQGGLAIGIVLMQALYASNYLATHGMLIYTA